jgi:hypothetical protein
MDDDAVQYESGLKYVDPSVDTTPSGMKDYVSNQYTEDRGGRHRSGREGSRRSCSL